MKKLFSLLTLALLTMSAWAATAVTIDFSAQGYENAADVTTLTLDGVTLTFSQGEGGNAPKYYTSGSAVRLYSKNTMEVSASENITKIEFTFSGNGTWTATSASVGAYADGAWTGKAQDITFTNDNSGTTQVRIQKMVVTLGEGGDDPVVPPTGATVFKKVTSATELVAGQQYILVNEDNNKAMGNIVTYGSNNVGEAIDVTINNSTVSIADTGVKALTLGGEAGAWTFSIDANYIAWTSGNTLTTATELSDNAKWTVSEAFTLTNVADSTRALQYNQGSPRFACYTSNQKPAVLYVQTDSVAPVTPPTEVANIAAANQVPAGDKFIFTGNAVVAYKHGNQLWLRDASGSAYAYNATDSTIAQGTVIASNWGATMATYNNKPEYTNLTDFVASGTQEVLPYEYQTITLDNYAEYVIVKGLKFVSTSTSGSHDNYVTEDGLTVRDNFDILKGHYDENATYDITGVVTAYNGAVQLYITDYEAIVGVAMPVIEPNGGTFADEVEVTITCATDGADIYYTINDGDEILYQGPFTLTETATVKAYADLNGEESSMATATFNIVEAVTYTLVTDGAQLADGDKIILVSTAEAGDAYAMGAAKSNNFGVVDVTITEDKTITTHDANVITLGANGDNWTLLANEGYLYAASSSKNYLQAEAEVDSNAVAQIVVSDSAAVFIQFQGTNTRNILRYNPNNDSPLFSCYNETSSIQNPVYIFKAGTVEPQPQGLRGDVDLSEEVTIADVSALIDYLLTGDATGISLQNADCDLSGNGTPDVTIADVSALIDYLLNNAW
jgi:hypothetical protein